MLGKYENQIAFDATRIAGISSTNLFELPSSRQDRESAIITPTQLAQAQDVSSPTRDQNFWNQKKVKLGLTN